MNKAIWNGVTLAESNECIKLENNYYFPIDSVKSEYLILSDHRTQYSWKGAAHYYHVDFAFLTNNEPIPRPTTSGERYRWSIQPTPSFFDRDIMPTIMSFFTAM